MSPRDSLAVVVAALLLVCAGCGAQVKDCLERGNRLAKAGRHRAAIAYYDDALLLDPNCVQAILQRGLLLEELGEYPRAIADLGRALQIDAENARARYARAKSHLQLGQYQRAVDDFTVLLDRGDQRALVRLSRGQALLEAGEYDAAVADLTLAANDPQCRAPAVLLRGLAHYRSDRLNLADDDFSQAIQLQPTNARAYWNRARVRTLLGDSALAEVDRRRASAIDPSLGVSNQFLDAEARSRRRDLSPGALDVPADAGEAR